MKARRVPAFRRNPRTPRRQRGQSMTEYVVICVGVFAGLFAGNPSLAQQLAAAVKAFYRAVSFYISLP